MFYIIHTAMATKTTSNNVDIDKENSSVQIDFEVSTSVWDHFTKSDDKNRAICSICKTSIKTQGGTTSGLHVHLKSKHNITIAKASVKGILICSMS